MLSRRYFLDITGSVTAASILAALRPVRVAKAAEDDKNAWEVKGLYMEACNCEAMCPCVVGNAPTAGFCGVLLGYHVQSGRKGDVVLDGLNVVEMISSPGHMAKGNLRAAFYIDECANPAQRERAECHLFLQTGRRVCVASWFGVRITWRKVRADHVRGPRTSVEDVIATSGSSSTTRMLTLTMLPPPKSFCACAAIGQ